MPKKKCQKLDAKLYKKELLRLQEELCYLQRWLRETGEKAIVVFEGRDAAGKGGVIKRITERVSPRVFRVVALPSPSDRQKSQMYVQRYVEHFPAAGEIVLFDRSWYNRAGVERVMGFCEDDEYQAFLDLAPDFEKAIVKNAGIKLIKYFLDVGPEEQERRFYRRIEHPMRHWKLSDIDIESYRRWWDYTDAYQKMIDTTDTKYAPWYRVDADDKKRARLNCIAHLLDQFPYERIPFTPVELPKRKHREKHTPKAIKFKHEVEDRFA